MKLQLCRAYGAQYIILSVLLLAIVVACLLGQALNFYCGSFHEFQTALLSVQWMLLACLSVWCGTFLFLTFNQKDWPLICLLLVAIVHYFTGDTEFYRAADAIILLAGVTLGRGMQFLLQSGKRKAKSESQIKNYSIVGDEVTSLISKPGNQKPENQLETPHVVSNFLIGLVVLLVFSAWWHVDLPGGYHGPRWMGLWNNPNIYGMLMGAGAVLAIGLRAQNMKAEIEEERAENRNISANRKVESRKQKWLIGFLWIAIFMLGVGLVMSYSRGAWLGTTVGLLYLSWAYGKLKWRWVVIGVGCVALGALCLWGRTADNGPWYLKRLDFSRPSAQHRVSAWHGALHIMRDHPLGVGWNQAVATYNKYYSPPEGGAPALTTNSYLMLGTELGLPGLLCFVAYVGLQLKTESRKQKAESLSIERTRTGSCNKASQLRCTCHAGVIVLLVTFWFDGGLFDLPTVAVFWILLELGTETQNRPATTTLGRG